MADREAGDAGAAGRREAMEWLEPRLRDAPSQLAEAVRGCLERAEPDETPDGVPGWMAHAALGEFGRVRAGRTGDRDEALRLLAADASLTFAFEAAAERGDELGRLAREWGAEGRLGRKLAARVREAA